MNDSAVKGISFVSVVVTHVAAIFVLSQLRSSKTVDMRSAEAATLLWIQAETGKEPGQTRARDKDRRRMTSSAISESVLQLVSTATPIATDSRVTAPTIDWATERERAAAGVVAREPQPAEDGAPDRNQLPDLGSANRIVEKPLHQGGDSQHFDSGEIVTWTDERKGRCYVTNLPAATPQLDERAIVKVCKPVQRPAGPSLEDRATPRYLRKANESP